GFGGARAGEPLGKMRRHFPVFELFYRPTGTADVGNAAGQTAVRPNFPNWDSPIEANNRCATPGMGLSRLDNFCAKILAHGRALHRVLGTAVAYLDGRSRRWLRFSTGVGRVVIGPDVFNLLF